MEGPSGEVVLVSAERLRELEAAAAKAANATEYLKKKNVRNLKSYHTNKDEINKRRRERYKAKKEAEARATEGTPIQA